jgi:two-component system osmolarity sensor histidine kinase EnvZ
MKRPLDSLFGRLAVTAVILIVLVQATMVLLVDRSRAELDTLHISRAARAIMLVRDRNPALAADMAKAMDISFVEAGQLEASGCPAPCTDTHGALEDHLRPLLPPGTQVVLGPADTLWIHAGGHPYAVRIPHALVPLGRFFAATAVTLAMAVAAAVLLAWQMQRPIHNLAEAARAYRRGGGLRQVAARGPSELRELIGDFNDMVSELAESERERAEMLASIAHDLRTPLTRIQVRADLLDGQRDRTAFLRDTESMGRIITQFLSFAGPAPGNSDESGVDAHCRRNYTDLLDGETVETDALVKLDLRAGEGFTLPSVDIDRILSNLIENAMTYGEPPVEIATALHRGYYVLAVRDHGEGIPHAQLDRVLRPFVRLDAARGGNAHCGLGLAIVRRIVRHHGGTLAVSNAASGGFVVTLRFPAREPGEQPPGSGKR